MCCKLGLVLIPIGQVSTWQKLLPKLAFSSLPIGLTREAKDRMGQGLNSLLIPSSLVLSRQGQDT